MAGVLTARYAALQSSYWGAFCLVINFVSVFLLAHGLTNAQIGVLMAVASAVATVVQPIVAGRVDRSRIPLRLWLVMGGIVVVALAAALLPMGGGVLVAIAYGLLVALIQVVQPIVNSVGMAAISQGFRVNFGVARACGSVSYALLSLGAGALVAATSAKLLLLLLVVTAAVFIAASATFVLRHPDPTAPEGRPPDSPHGSERADVEPTADAASHPEGVAVARHPEPAALDRRAWGLFLLLLVGITLGMTSHNLINTFLFQIVGSHGGDAAVLGLAAMIAAMVELPTMVFFERLLTRWTPGTLLVVGGIVFAVKNLATYLAPSLTVIYFVQLLQFAGFGLVIPATVYYVNRLFPSAQRVRGQAYMTMTFSAGSVFGALIGGVVLDAAGVPTLLLVGTAVATVGAALVWAGADRR
jgi:PPP family 3-phenylpropionic acid transporter